MKTLKVVISLMLFVICFMILSCECGTTYLKYVENNSTATIEIEIISFDGTIQKSTVAPGKTTEIYVDDQLGSFPGENYRCTLEFHTVMVTVSDNLTLKKEIMNADNWFMTSKTGRNSIIKCYFSIRDEDLE